MVRLAKLLFFPNFFLQKFFLLFLLDTTRNYPISLLGKPMIAALAAGNKVFLKPSELALHTSALFAKLIPQYFDKDTVAIVEGGPAVASELLKHKFNYIFFTGSPNVGKVVMKAASEHLTPVTLELGGKSPCIVDKNSKLDVAVKRIVWAKLMNIGQTCISPDYCYVHEDIKQEFLSKFKATLKEFFGENEQLSEDYSRIINTRHVQRIKQLIEGEKIYYGGKVDEQDLYIQPTLVDDPSEDSPVMKEEVCCFFFFIYLFLKHAHIV